jgi:hypothetical protein
MGNKSDSVDGRCETPHLNMDDYVHHLPRLFTPTCDHSWILEVRRDMLQVGRRGGLVERLVVTQECPVKGGDD